MAEQNICTVDLLQDMTTDTNALVEENGELKRVNLDREKTKLTTEISTLNTQIFNMGNQISELEKSNAELETENASLKTQIAELNGKTAVFVKKMTTGATFGDVTVYLPKDVTNAVVIPTVINNHYVVCLNTIARAGAGSNISLIVRNISAGDAVINEEVDIRVVAIFP